MIRALLVLLLVAGLTACADRPLTYTGQYGRPNYEGSGPFVRDPAQSRAEARAYRVHAVGSYRQPGPADDQWGPYIDAAATRFGIPERWVRACNAPGIRRAPACGGWIADHVVERRNGADAGDAIHLRHAAPSL